MLKRLKQFLAVFVFVWLVLYVIAHQRATFERNATYSVTNDLQVVASKPENENLEEVKSPNCVKPANAKSHIICDSLPFQTPKCRSNTEGRVPNIVHYIWIGNGTLKMYQYISILSVATNQNPDKILFHFNDIVPQGEFWLKLVAQIPCLETQKFEVPTHIFGNQMTIEMMINDVARFQIVLEHGGIYVDSDVIVLKSLDPLRQHPFTMGYNGMRSLSAGAFLSEPNSAFLQELMNGYKDLNKINKTSAYFSCLRARDLAITRKDLRINVEDISMQRPNLWIDKESIGEVSFDLSYNYMLHLHPRHIKKHFSADFLEWGIHKLRVHDSTYGAAARAALFGTRDLVFLRGEEALANDRKPPKPIQLIAYDKKPHGK